jgi:hypothetical protein
MKPRLIGGTLLAISCVATVLLSGTGSTLQAQGGREGAEEVYTGTAVSMGGATRYFTLTITGRTPDAEAKQYLQILQSQGQDALLKAIQKNKLGTIQFEGLGRDINVVREKQTEAGRKITIVFERWLQFFELRYGTRSVDYPFTYIELYINAQGKGEGTMIGAARISWDKKKDAIDVENFATYPLRLVNVERRK